jgi:hypothetical protein
MKIDFKPDTSFQPLLEEVMPGFIINPIEICQSLMQLGWVLRCLIIDKNNPDICTYFTYKIPNRELLDGLNNNGRIISIFVKTLMSKYFEYRLFPDASFDREDNFFA